MKRTRVLLLLAAACISAMAVGQQQQDLQTITVSGNGIAYVQPDVATITVGVQVQKPTAREAQQSASATTQQVLDSIAKLGIEKSQMQTSSLSLQPVYDNRPERPTGVQMVVAYMARNTIRIRLRDLSKIGPVVDAAVAAGANDVESIGFGRENDAEARKESLRAAVIEARAKALAIAEALGVRLGAIQDVTESGGWMPQPTMRFGGADMAAATPVVPGEVGIQSSVTIRFRIIQ